MLPQVGQGALAIECRVGDVDGPVGELLRAIEDGPSRLTLEAERGFLTELGGDCDLPAGAHAVVDPDGSLRVEGLIASLDGHTVLRHALVAPPEGLGQGRDRLTAAAALGGRVGAFLLHDAGGAALLDR
jgi:hydroxymethylbilane synthase